MPDIRFASIFLPFWGKHASPEVVQSACKIAKLDRSRLFALFVLEVPQALPLDVHLPEEVEKGETLLREVTGIAKRSRVKLETKLVRSRFAGRTIVEETKANKCDLILFGSARSEVAGMLRGKVLPFILLKSPCRVWIWRHSS